MARGKALLTWLHVCELVIENNFNVCQLWPKGIGLAGDWMKQLSTTMYQISEHLQKSSICSGADIHCSSFIKQM